jgi:hypothetical protein
MFIYSCSVIYYTPVLVLIIITLISLVWLQLAPSIVVWSRRQYKFTCYLCFAHKHWHLINCIWLKANQSSFCISQAKTLGCSRCLRNVNEYCFMSPLCTCVRLNWANQSLEQVFENDPWNVNIRLYKTDVLSESQYLIRSPNYWSLSS